MTCSMPEAAMRDSRWVRKGSPAVGSIGLGADRVSGRSRVPLPPTSTTASTFDGSTTLLTTHPLPHGSTAVPPGTTHHQA